MDVKKQTGMWKDSEGNTCFGINPEFEKAFESAEEKEEPKPISTEKEEEDVEHGSKKAAKDNRRKRP